MGIYVSGLQLDSFLQMKRSLFPIAFPC
jgi:hypothetical protein